MKRDGIIRWGILGTARIAQTSFLPGMRAAGGTAAVVAGRNRQRTEEYAAANGIERAVEGYEAVLDDERIDAVYIPLPNGLHAEWTIKALQAGKAVLCEKPLCVSVDETRNVLDVARASTSPLWEAFVFPFREQTRRLHDVIARGDVGEVYAIHSGYHFTLRSRANIRLNPDLGGGSLYDVGCYPLRLANELFDHDPRQTFAVARWSSEGVDEEMQGIVTYSRDRRLLFTCSMVRSQDTFSRIIGLDGEIRLTNAFHPAHQDTLEVRVKNRTVIEHCNGQEPTFAPAIQHIHAVLRGEEKPRHLAVDDALSNALAIDCLLQSARNGTMETISVP